LLLSRSPMNFISLKTIIKFPLILLSPSGIPHSRHTLSHESLSSLAFWDTTHLAFLYLTNLHYLNLCRLLLSWSSLYTHLMPFIPGWEKYSIVKA
jgi:hypothetical protein